jgi:hypothetical protein
MATVHGFRIFSVQVFGNRKKGNTPFDVSVGSETQQNIYGLLEGLYRGGTRFVEAAAPKDPAEPKRGAQSITVGETFLVRPDFWHVQVSIGQEGLHPTARHRSKKAKKLMKYAAEVPHYVSFWFPAAGDTFVVVAQTTNRRDPTAALFRALTEIGMSEKKEAETLEKELRRQCRAQKIKPPAPQNHTRLLFERKQAVDNAYIDDIIQNAKTASAVLTQRVPSPRGAASDVVGRVLSIKLLDDSGREVGSNLSRRWSGARRRGEAKSQADGVSELAEQLTTKNLLDDGEADHYNDARIEVTDRSGVATSIAVDTAKDVFTYPVSDGYPGVYYFYEKVADRARTVALELGVDVDDIDPVEVEQCLDGSTSAP